MTFDFENLTSDVRRLMQEEVDLDDNTGQLYRSKVLTAAGYDQWPDMLATAIAHGAEWSLTNAVSQFLVHCDRRGHRTSSDAAARLAEGEFNRYYIRAVCRAALEQGLALEVYRAKPVLTPRARSEDWIGRKIDAPGLLHDLRRLPGEHTVWGVPGGCNSGISVRLSRDSNARTAS